MVIGSDLAEPSEETTPRYLPMAGPRDAVATNPGIVITLSFHSYA
jgi:hypothetical protein